MLVQTEVEGEIAIMNVVFFRSLFAATLFGAIALGGCSGGASVGAPAPIASASATSASPKASGSPSGASSDTPSPSSAVSATATATATGTSARPTPTAAPSPSASGSAAAALTTCVPGMNPTVSTVTRTPVKLSSYNVDPQKVFVAGISSGGFFGVQMHLAHSSVFKGAAIYAGGVFYCSQDSIALALAECGGETNVDCQALYQSTLSTSEAYVDTQSAAGTIDPEKNVAGQPVYLWSGTKDQVVNPMEMADLDSEYRHLGANVTFENTYPANHGWESPDGEVPCPTATEPYMVSCAGSNGQPYDSVETWLTKFLGTLNARNASPSGSLINFDQTEFGASASNSMDTNGWVYVPQSCASGASCGFVLALHGCIQNQGIIGTKFITEAGIDEWADTNALIVLYPYAVEATLTSSGGTNPMGCWDWWGYDDPNYALKTGTQMSAVYKMVQRVTGITRP